MIGSSIRLRSWIPRYEIVRRKEPESRLRQWNVRVSRSRIALITHAPAWGRTFHWVLLSGGTWASTHAPRVGANAHEGALAHAGAGATTRAPVWGRTASSCQSRQGRLSSTHAPVWGRTEAIYTIPKIVKLQLTPPCGGERCRRMRPVRSMQLQLTRPCGGRTASTRMPSKTFEVFNSRSRVDEQCTGCRPQRYTRYNSRPRVGANGKSRSQLKALLWASTHAPVWGRTDAAQLCGPAVSGFNSRPRVGANQDSAPPTRGLD